MRSALSIGVSVLLSLGTIYYGNLVALRALLAEGGQEIRHRQVEASGVGALCRFLQLCHKARIESSSLGQVGEVGSSLIH